MLHGPCGKSCGSETPRDSARLASAPARSDAMKRETARYTCIAALGSWGTNHIGDTSPCSPISATLALASVSASMALLKRPCNQPKTPKAARLIGR